MIFTKIIYVVIVSLVFAMTGCDTPHVVSKQNYVAQVDHESICVKEFEQSIETHKPAVYHWFAQRYPITDSVAFWQTNYQGQTPGQRLKEIALNDCIRMKIQQILAKEQGLIRDISYAAFLARLKEENEKRQMEIERRKVIYDQEQVGEATYFNYTMNALIQKLKRVLASDTAVQRNENLKRFYETYKDSLFRKDDVITIEQIAAAVKDSAARRLVNARFRRIKDRIDRGESLAKIATQEGAHVTYRVLIVDDFVAGADEQVIYAAGNLQPGESRIVNGETAIYLIRCRKRDKGGYLTFDENVDYIKEKYIDKVYNEIVSRRLKNARIDINYPVYNAITIH